ncbi:MAG TPA: TerC family protein [Candidatus Hydrogenedentes bacterium]|nr:TerC family protein [Candidatus Hydrogenedentota bacterium]HOS02891.1 TerC family protein [Candidatus Hydrogenedentota bacterium]
MFHEIFVAENLIALLTLTALEIVLGIDNIVVIAIVTGKLDKRSGAIARQTGLALAMGMRILLLLSIRWMMGLTMPLFSVFEHAVTGKDLILLGGGAFLIGKSTYEIHERVEGPDSIDAVKRRSVGSLRTAIIQIALLDIVFSLDSVITAVGMAQRLWVMIFAIVAAILMMMAFSGAITAFIHRHPTLKVLALAFLMLIGAMLVAEGLGKHIEKGYIYFAMAFSLFVEMLNLRAQKKAPLLPKPQGEKP